MKMANDKILSMIGLAKRANKVSTGEFICKKAIKSGMAKLAILAVDASENTKKSILNSCNYYKVNSVECADMESLGKYSGGGERAVVTINDINLSNAIIKLINNA